MMFRSEGMRAVGVGCWCAVVLSTVVLAGATVASAQGEGAAKQFLKSLDADGNGWVGRDEWKGSGATFLSLDRDLDGWLTAAELARTAGDSKKSATGDDSLAFERVTVAIRELRDPPDLLAARCTTCHDTMRIERAQKNASGWSDTVKRMREKKEAKISDKEAKVIVDYLTSQRARVARSVVGYGSDDPVRDWSFVVGRGDLHQFDRDRDGRLDAAELSRLVHERADVDANGSLSPGEFALLPLAADRRALFAKLDRDHNGALSQKELGTPSPLVDLADRNGDQAISREELPNARGVGGPYPMILASDAKAALQILDRNHDGKLSSKELEHFPGTLARFDDDHDSALDSKELETAVTAARAEGPYAAFDDFFTRYDLDGDGSVSRLEFPGRSGMFQRLDVDGDGAVSSREAPDGWRRPEFTSEAQRWRQ